MKVAIDPGHGGSDPGAIGAAGSREADINLSIGVNLRSLLEASGCTVIMTRETDSDCAAYNADAYQELQARCYIANRHGADLYLSIHCNAAANVQANGSETWYYDAGQVLAEGVQRELSRTGLTDRGIKQGSFYVLKHTDMPAVIVETGFLTNAQEEALLNDSEFQWGLAKALARGILRYMNAGERSV